MMTQYIMHNTPRSDASCGSHMQKQLIRPRQNRALIAEAGAGFHESLNLAEHLCMQIPNFPVVRAERIPGPKYAGP